MSAIRFLLIMLLLAILAFAVSAQDVPLVTYDEVNTASLDEDALQFFAQFEGTTGDVVYLLAEWSEFSSADIEIDMRDSVGRTVGFRQEYAFNWFVIAELPADGLYTIVITGEEAGDVDYIVGKSGYLEDGVEGYVDRESFDTLFLVRAEEDGNYTLSFSQEGGMGTEFRLITFSETFSENIILVNGTSFNEWSASIELNEGDTYVAFLGRNIFLGDGEEATVSIQLEQEE